MKVLLMNTEDIKGGAARAAYRLHKGLHNSGLKSQFLVQKKSSSDTEVFAPKNSLSKGIATARIGFDALPLKFYKNRENTVFSLQWLPDQTAASVNHIAPDIINLHWLGDAFVRVETLKRFNRPLVLTLHDMWAMTGGCHYSGDCEQYTVSCGKCPQLGSESELDLSRWLWKRKVKAWEKLDITIVTLCAWMAECVQKSSLFKSVRTEVIPNGIDTDVYKPLDKKVARQLLRLPQHKTLILFASLDATSNKRKGFHLLKAALEKLQQTQWKEELELVILGAGKPDNPSNYGFKVHYLNTLQDDLSLALAYSAADAFVLPSTQENLANTILEAGACGTPSVAFDIGGMPDLIESHSSGYLAEPFSVEDLAKGIIWVTEDTERQQALSKRARSKIEEEFSQALQAKRYISLFEEVLARTA